MGTFLSRYGIPWLPISIGGRFSVIYFQEILIGILVFLSMNLDVWQFLSRFISKEFIGIGSAVLFLWFVSKKCWDLDWNIGIFEANC